MTEPPVQFGDNSDRDLPESQTAPGAPEGDSPDQARERRQKFLIAGAVIIAFLVAGFALLEARSAKEEASSASEANSALQSENKQELRREYVKIEKQIKAGKAEISRLSSSEGKSIDGLQKRTEELARQSEQSSKANLRSSREMEQEINQLRSQISRLSARIDRLEEN